MFKSKKLISKLQHDYNVKEGECEILLSLNNKLQHDYDLVRLDYAGLREKCEIVKELRDIQGSYGNWNSDMYNLGLFNGLEMALCIIENRDPDYRNANDQPFAFDANGAIPTLEPVFDSAEKDLIDHINALPANQEE